MGEREVGRARAERLCTHADDHRRRGGGSVSGGAGRRARRRARRASTPAGTATATAAAGRGVQGGGDRVGAGCPPPHSPCARPAHAGPARRGGVGPAERARWQQSKVDGGGSCHTGRQRPHAGGGEGGGGRRGLPRRPALAPRAPPRAGKGEVRDAAGRRFGAWVACGLFKLQSGPPKLLLAILDTIMQVHIELFTMANTW